MEENREVFGEDMDIENLAAVLSDSGESEGKKEAPAPDSVPEPPPPDDSEVSAGPAEAPEPPVPSEEPAVPQEEPAQSPVSDDSEGSEAVKPLDGAEGLESESARTGASVTADEASSASADGDIEALIKKYEEIPSGKKEIVKKDSGGVKGKSLPLAAIAAAAGVIIILALLKFVVFKPAPAVKKIQPKQLPSKTAAVPAGAVSAGVDYPGGVVLLGETKEGIEIKIFLTAAVSRDIKLFYQKKMAEKGFELSTSRKSRRTFNMNFFKGASGYSVSVVPHAGKNLIIVTHAE